MKTLLSTLLLLTIQAHAFEWEAGVREIYITKKTYSYNSDSSSRIRRELSDRGYKRIAIEPRIAFSSERSLFYLPPIKSSFDDLGIMNTRISQADGKMTLRPIIYENPALGEARPLSQVVTNRPDLSLISYGQILSQFVQISRDQSIDRLVIGSGIAGLLSQKELIPRFEALFKSVRKSLGTKTELVFEVVGENELKALASAISHNFQLAQLVDGLSIVLQPETHFPQGVIDLEAVKKTRFDLETILPGMPIHLSRVAVPACSKSTVMGGEYYCTSSDKDYKRQFHNFMELKKALLILEEEGSLFKTVETLEATTDFEPQNPDARYPYYNPLLNDPVHYELPAKEPVILPGQEVLPRTASQVACLYFDKNDLPPMIDRVGDIHSIMLESLMGAFNNWKVKRTALKNYLPGEISGCHAVFYVATNFAQELPLGFAEEVAFASNQIPVVWFNYKLSRLNTALKNINQDPGFDAAILMQPDSTPSPENQDPGFFRFFDYKDETFFKLAQWNPAANNFAASPELNLIKIQDENKVDVLSTSRHSKSNQTVPYAVRSGNIWYLADSPFSFVHYEDRFYIFSDLLWDILNEVAPTERIALARIEDVGPNLNMDDLHWAMDYMFQQDVPFSLAVIPYYSDMIGPTDTNIPIYAPITKYPSFVAQLRYAKNRGASIVMHGTAHSVGSLISGYVGTSGSDYEFWLYPENRPLPFDSIDWVTRRLEAGIKVFQDLKLEVAAFEVPHYAASVMNYVVFSKFFRWNYHRTIYFPHSISKNTSMPEELTAFSCDPKICGDERRAILNNLKIEADYTSFGGVTLPFITHRDAYGQSLIPETLGMIDFAFYDSQTWRPVSKPEDIIRRAKKLKVIRGAVASFFWHPQLLDPQSRYYQEVPGSFEKMGGKKSLSLVIEGLKKLGYEFTSIENQNYFPKKEVL